MTLGDRYICNDCEHMWESKKKFGEPAICPKCKKKNIENIEGQLRVKENAEVEKRINALKKEQKQKKVEINKKKKKGSRVYGGEWKSKEETEKIIKDFANKYAFGKTILWLFVAFATWWIVGLFYGLVTDNVDMMGKIMSWFYKRFGWALFAIVIYTLAYLKGNKKKREQIELETEHQLPDKSDFY